MTRWGRFVLAYAILAVISIAVGLWWHGEVPIAVADSWFGLSAPASHLYSGILGLALGCLTVVVTRISVIRFAWARRLHSELRPLARGISSTGIVMLALLSAVGEELLFRGLLQPWLGLVPQAVLFGLVHQLPGKSRWVWVLWAGLVGLLLGIVFQLTGSLLGPIAAHALVNGLNLSYLKHNDLQPRRRDLGGLLGTNES